MSNISIPKSRIMFSTLRYENVYGKRPYGFGTWYFRCKGDNLPVKEISFICKFGEAKSKAMAYCAENGYYICSTLS